MPIRLNSWRIVRFYRVDQCDSIRKGDPYLFNAPFQLVTSANFVMNTRLKHIDVTFFYEPLGRLLGGLGTSVSKYKSNVVISISP